MPRSASMSAGRPIHGHSISRHRLDFPSHITLGVKSRVGITQRLGNIRTTFVKSSSTLDNTAVEMQRRLHELRRRTLQKSSRSVGSCKFAPSSRESPNPPCGRVGHVCDLVPLQAHHRACSSSTDHLPHHPAPLRDLAFRAEPKRGIERFRPGVKVGASLRSAVLDLFWV